MTPREWLRRIFTTRRARELATALALREAEVARLRAENRALLNSILGIAGIPPVLVEEPPPDPREGLSAIAHDATRSEEDSAAPRPPRANGAAAPRHAGALPLRRRSWQQIHRRLEIEAARKKASQA